MGSHTLHQPEIIIPAFMCHRKQLLGFTYDNLLIVVVINIYKVCTAKEYPVWSSGQNRPVNPYHTPAVFWVFRASVSVNACYISWWQIKHRELWYHIIWYHEHNTKCILNGLILTTRLYEQDHHKGSAILSSVVLTNLVDWGDWQLDPTHMPRFPAVSSPFFWRAWPAGRSQLTRVQWGYNRIKAGDYADLF